MIGLMITLFITGVILIISSLPDINHEYMAGIRTVTAGVGIIIILIATWVTAIAAARRQR